MMRDVAGKLLADSLVLEEAVVLVFVDAFVIVSRH